MGDSFDGALSELSNACKGINPDAVNSAVKCIAEARNVIVYGCGRERLQLMGFAMRLFHLGFKASVVGDMTTPAAGKGDLFIATVGPGNLATVEALLRKAKKAGARTLAITAQPEGHTAKEADDVLVIPAQTMTDDGGHTTSILPMGSAFEGALFVLFEVMVLELKERLGVTSESMRARHANLE